MQNTRTETDADTGRAAPPDAAGQTAGHTVASAGAPPDRPSRNPSGGRRWGAAEWAAADVADAFQGLEPHQDRFTASRLLQRVAAEIGWPQRHVAHFTFLVERTRPCDWEPGRRPIVWLSVKNTARLLGISESQLSHYERFLVAEGFVARRDSPNYRRYGRRGPDGHIVEAYGLDLSPSAAMIPRLESLAETVSQAQIDTRKQTVRLSATARQCCCAIHTAVGDGVLSNAPAHRSRASLRACTANVHADTPSAELRSRIAAVKRLEGSVRAVVEGYEQPPETAPASAACAAETSSPAASWHARTQATAREYTSHGMRKLKPPLQYNTRDSILEGTLQGAGGRKDSVAAGDGPAAHPAAAAPGRPLLPRAPSDTSATAEAPLPFAFDTLLAVLPPSIKARLPRPRPSWAELTDATAAVGATLGISQHAWAEACGTLGRQAATAAVVVIAARHEQGRIASPGGYLRAMTRREEEGELRLGASVHSLLQRPGRTADMKPPPTPAAALDDNAPPAPSDSVPTGRRGIPAPHSTWRENLFASASRLALRGHADAYPPPSSVAPPTAVAGVRRQILDVVLPALHPPVQARLPHDRPPAVRDVVNAVEDAVGAGDLLMTPLELASMQDAYGPVTAALHVISRSVENRPGATRHRLALYRRLMRRPWRDAAMSAWERLDRHMDNCDNRSARRSREGWSRSPVPPSLDLNFDSFLNRSQDDPEPPRLDQAAAEAEYLGHARRDGVTMNFQVHTLPTHPQRGGGLRRWLQAVALRLVPPEVRVRLPMGARPSLREIIDAVDAAAAAGEFTMPHSALRRWSGRFGRAAGTTLFVAVARDNCLGSPEPPFTTDPARVRDRHAERELYDTVLFHLPNHFDRHRRRERRGRRAGRGQAPWFETALAIVPPEVRRLFPPERPPAVADILGAGCHTLLALGLNGLLLGQILGIREATNECFRMAAERPDAIRAWIDRYLALKNQYEEEFRHRKDTRLHGLDDTVVDFRRPDGKER